MACLPGMTQTLPSRFLYRWLNEMSRSNSTRNLSKWSRYARTLSLPALGHVERDAADAVVVVGEPRAAERLDEVVDGLALAQAVDHRREGADVHRHRADRDEVRGDAAELAGDGAEPLGPGRHLDLEEPLDRDRVALVREHRRDVVDAVGVRHEPRVAGDLADLLDGPVQVADVRDGLLHDLAVGLDDEVDDAVGGGVLRAEVEDHLLVLTVHAAEDELLHGRSS